MIIDQVLFKNIIDNWLKYRLAFINLYKNIQG